MNINNEIKKTEKGCEKEIYQGQYLPNEVCGLGMFCPICQERLKTLKECQKIISDLGNGIEQIRQVAKLEANEQKDTEWKKKIDNEIEELIDHYIPYRQITDSKKAQEIRKVLTELKQNLLGENEK